MSILFHIIYILTMKGIHLRYENLMTLFLVSHVLSISFLRHSLAIIDNLTCHSPIYHMNLPPYISHLISCIWYKSYAESLISLTISLIIHKWIAYNWDIKYWLCHIYINYISYPSYPIYVLNISHLICKILHLIIW